MIPNIAKGKVAYYAGLPAANDALKWVLLTGTETDANLRDADTLTAILALGVDEATFTGYTRVTATGVTVTVDDTLDWVTADAADPSWSPTSAQVLTRIVLCYDPDTTTGTDADLIPLYIDSYPVTTPTTGTITYTVPGSGFYSEGDPAVTALVSLEDAKAHLNKSSLVLTDDSELRQVINAVTAAILGDPDYYIPVGLTEVTDEIVSVVGGAEAILANYPIVPGSVTITEYRAGTPQALAYEPITGGSFTSYGWSFQDGSGRSGIVVRSSGGSIANWCGAVVASYTYGTGTVPANVAQAALVAIKDFWRSQMGSGGGRAVPGADEILDEITPDGRAQIAYLLKGFRRAPVVA